MSPIQPHLWFDCPASAAAEFYTGLMPDSAITYVSHFQIPNGVCEVAAFTFAGQPFFGISGMPSAGINPSISFMINFDPSRDADAIKRIDQVWNQLSDGGKVMMPIDRYPFSERYGWVADRYGVNWQLILTRAEGEERPVILPSVIFTGDVAGRAEEAINFYCSIFKDGKRGVTAYYPTGMEPDQEGTLTFGDFYIDQTWIAAMDSAHSPGFPFNEAVSLLIICETQDEIDQYWTALSADGKPGQCGWLKDKFGVSWQVTSTVIFEALREGTPAQVDRVLKAFQLMKKVDVTALKRAYRET